MEKITYVGGSDVIRTGKGFSWREFQGDGQELIIDKQYNVLTSCCMQWTYIKNDEGNIVRDSSGERYLYWKIINEFGEEIYVWEGFFKENTGL